jgi:transketolase
MPLDREAKKVTDRPTIISLKTTIGFLSSKAGTHGVHGSPLGDADIRSIKTALGFDPDASFNVLKSLDNRNSN